MRATTIAVLLAAALCATAGAATAWHYPLYLANGGYWRQRVEVSVHNSQDKDIAGESVSVHIGTGPNDANLVGAEAAAVRVCDADGRELLYAITGPTGRTVDAGSIPDGSILTLPVVCPAGKSTSCFIYFDNPQAWAVPDFLKAASGIRNPGVEEGSGDTPDGWSHDSEDVQHIASWSTESPHSGKRCLKTVVADGAEPTWIATRQRDIKIIGGARYVMRAWVKAQNVKGSCGWYIHVGNSTNNMLISPMLTVTDSTFGWRELKTEFTAPADADVADLGTVLRGTGTAWFDDISLECLDKQLEITPTVGPVEKLALREVGADSTWYDDNASDDLYWDWRVPVRVLQMPDPAAKPRTLLIAADVSPLVARMRGRFSPESLRVVGDGKLLIHSLLKDTVLFQAQLAPGTATTFYLYLSADPRFSATQRKATVAATGDDNTDVGSHVPVVGDQTGRDAATLASYEQILNSPANLSRNPSFEEGKGTPDAWPGSAEGARPEGTELGLAQPGLFGKQCARMHIPHTSQKAWTGWRQDVPVTPGKTYLYAAWLKCEDLEGGSLQLHAHERTATGEMVKSGGFTGAGPAISGTTDWTLISGVFSVPDDCQIFQTHLTMLATGTAWHDGVVVAEVAQATTGATESRGAATATGLTIWPVNPVVKVFHEDPAPRAIEPARITAARNDREPLQLAVRGPRLAQVRVAVDKPTGPAGAQLSDCQVTVVGYVPIDAKSSYYSTAVQPWERKLPPASSGGSDGWPGWWPDPLLPQDHFALEANSTQPVWITVSVPKGAAPGDYKGAVRFLNEGIQLARVPFTVHVWDFELPDQLHTAAIYDVRMSGRWNVPGQSAEETRNQFLKFMADRRVCPDRVSPDPVLRYENGKVVADFTAYDRAAEYYFDVLKLPHSYTPSVFYCFGWGHPPGVKFGQAPYEGAYPYEDVDRGKLRPEFIAAYQACLRTYLDHMKQKGWYDRIALYISDEPYDSKPYIQDQMKALCAMIRAVDPKLPIYCSTWHHQPAWDGSLTLWGIGHYGVVPVETMDHIRQTGARMWFTTDGQMCTDTPYCGVERLLPRYCFKYGVDAYEFWGCTWLTYDPYQYGWHSFIYQSGEPGKFSWVRYPNGDGFLAYPGSLIGYNGPVSSVRLEQAREGVEDYEYLYLLRQRITAAKAAGHDVTAAQHALDEALDLVQIPNAGGRYSTRILPDPDRLPVLKESVARAIESLR